MEPLSWVLSRDLTQEAPSLLYVTFITSSGNVVWAQSSCVQASSSAWPYLKLIFQ